MKRNGPEPFFGEQILLTGSDSGEVPAFQASEAGSDMVSVTNADGETAQLAVQIEK